MKPSWEKKCLVQVCDFQNGFAFKSKTFKSSGTPVVRITNIKNERVDISNAVFVDKSDYDQDLSRYKLSKGDLLIAMSGATTGKIGINRNEKTLYLNQRVGKFSPFDSLSKKYLYYYLSTKVEDNLLISAGSAQPNLSTNQINNFLIPIPPLDEQEEIVEVLDKAFAAIDQAKANIEKNIENAKELFQSKLNQIFTQKGEGWEETTIGEQLTLQRGFDITKKQQRPGTVPVVSSGGVKSYHDTAKVEAPGVVVGRKGTIGKVHYIETDFWPHDTTLWIKDYKGNEPKLTYYLLNGINLAALDSGSANPALNRNVVHPVTISWPRMANQKAFVKQLDSLSKATRSIESHYPRRTKEIHPSKSFRRRTDIVDQCPKTNPY